MKKVLLLLVFSLCLVNTAHAYIRLEPYIGYEQGTGTNPGLGFKESGIHAGARAGWLSDAERYWVVFDYETSFDASITFGDDDASKFSKSIMALVVGMNFMERPWRIWAGYGIDEWNIKDGPKTKLKGNMMKVGIGYTKLKPASINFEYFSEGFNEASDDSGTGGDPEAKNTAYMLSVSWPMKFSF